MRVILLALILAAGQTYASGKPEVPNDPQPVAVSVSGAAAHAGAVATGGNSESTSVAAAAGGHAVAGDSSASVGDVGASASSGDASVGDISVMHRQVRQAPGIAMSHPQATMDCIRGFGIGGSNSNGALILGPQFKDGDCMALMQFNQLAELDLPLPAAKAYCARKRFWTPFGSLDACEAAIAQSLIDRRVPEVVERLVPDQACNEKLRRCEDVTGRK